MQYPDFWSYFNNYACPRLAHRADTFRYAFEHLSQLKRPVCIIETGCVRNAETWAGEGQSTVLFDRFSEYNQGSIIHSVDISPDSTSMCKAIVSGNVQVHTMDSVYFLRRKCAELIHPIKHIDLLYLDSFDVDFDEPHESAMHHMKELLAATPMISPSTLILIDDSPSSASFFMENGFMKLASNSKISGKGKYVAAYMESIANKPVIQSYQAAWLGI